MPDFEEFRWSDINNLAMYTIPRCVNDDVRQAYQNGIDIPLTKEERQSVKASVKHSRSQLFARLDAGMTEFDLNRLLWHHYGVLLQFRVKDRVNDTIKITLETTKVQLF